MQTCIINISHTANQNTADKTAALTMDFSHCNAVNCSDTCKFKNFMRSYLEEVGQAEEDGVKARMGKKKD
jgi:hypothetical protein